MTMRGLAASAALVAVVAGSAGCSVVTDYPKETAEARQAFQSGQFDDAYQKLEKGLERDLDKICYILERGMVTHVAGDYEKSNQCFDEAVKLFRQYEDDENVAEKAGQQAASMLVNEKMIPYKGEMFEKVLVPLYWGFNFLCTASDQDTFDKANVMIRQCNQRLGELRKEYEEDLAEAQNEKEGTTDDGAKVDCSAAMSAVTDEMGKARAGQESVIAGVRNVYDLAIGHYMSGVIYEEQADRGFKDELDNARISYERVYAMNPEFPLVKDDLVRISRKLNDGETAKKWISAGGKDWKKTADSGDVFIVYSCGLAPEKEELAIRFPIFIPGLMNDPVTDTVYGKVAIPLYKTTSTGDRAIALWCGGAEVAQSYPLTDVEAVAIKFLWDRMLLVSIKAAFRLAIRAAATYIASQAALSEGGTGGLVGNIAIRAGGAVATEVLEQADLRSWLTLPRNLQVLRVTLPAGPQELSLAVLGDGGSKMNTLDLGKVTVPKGRRLFISARTVGPNIFAKMAKGPGDLSLAPNRGTEVDGDGAEVIEYASVVDGDALVGGDGVRVAGGEHR